MHRVLLALVLLVTPALASAQQRVLIVHTSEDAAQARDLARWVRALRPALGDVAGSQALGDRCWPEDAGCAATLLGRAHADRLLLVRVVWDRAACVADHGGHRMLRTATLHLTLLDASGQVLGNVERSAAAADAAERRAAAVALLAQLGLAAH